MTALLSSRRPAWVWPASVAGAFLALLMLCLVPGAWWRLLWSGHSPPRELPEHTFRADLQIIELEPVRPPPPLAAATGADAQPEILPADPDWWWAAWHGRIEADWRSPAALPDSLLPAPLLAMLGVRATVDLILAAPDSLIEARLWWLVQTEDLTLNDLDGFYTAIARARAYADLKSREAAMFNEFQFETVPVTR